MQAGFLKKVKVIVKISILSVTLNSELILPTNLFEIVRIVHNPEIRIFIINLLKPILNFA